MVLVGNTKEAPVNSERTELSGVDHTTSGVSLPVRRVETAGAVEVRVRYCECDPMGVAHHASYIPWLEIARTELLRTSGISYAQLEAAGVFLVVAKLNVAYRRPVRYDDVVRIACRVVGTSRVKIEHAYALTAIERNGQAVEEEVSIASTTLACVDASGRVRTLPEWLMASESSSGDGDKGARDRGAVRSI